MATITGTATKRREASRAAIAHVDLVLLALPVAISALGLLMIYDASRAETANAGLSRLYYVERQGVAVMIGVVAMLLIATVDYRRIRDSWPLIYAATIPLLLGVLVLGRAHGGAQAWYQLGPLQFQPSEVAKVTLVIAIAGYCHQHRGDLDAWRLAVAIALAGAVMAIVYAQHDLGTTLVIMVCAGAVLVIAGLKPVHIVVLLALAATLVGAAVVTGRVQSYQQARFQCFAGNTSVTQNKDQCYNARHAVDAIAAGGLSGAGFGDGPLTRNGYVPEQHTDFIFTAVGEDLGFAGGATLLLLYALLAWRLWRIALLSSDFFGTLLAIGILAMFTIQIFENVGMTMGIMPITGIPLPFMSYGGSAVIASFIAIGLALNVHMRRFS